MSLADNLKYLRKKYNMTQEDLAASLDVSRQSVSKWETGEAYPETDKLIELCDTYNVTLDLLVRGNVANISQNKETDEKTSKPGTKQTAIFSALCTCVITCATCIFLALGFTLNLWYVSWIAYLFGIAICCILNIFYGTKHDNSDSTNDQTSRHISRRRAIADNICGAIMLVCTATFLLIGLLCNVWHPTWVIFVIGAAICTVLNILLDIHR
jgi:transcriptional regulator with XRE-family HTH domain